MITWPERLIIQRLDTSNTPLPSLLLPSLPPNCKKNNILEVKSPNWQFYQKRSCYAKEKIEKV